MFGTLFEHLFELEVPILRTVAGLTIRPGRVCREYVEGRRKRYTNPVKYAFLTTTLLTVAIAFFGVDLTGNTQQMLGLNAAATADASDAVDAQAEPAPQVTFVRDIQRWIQLSLNYMILLGLFGLPIVLKLLFRGNGYNYVEHLAFVMFSWGHSYLLSVPLHVMGVTNSLPMFITHITLSTAYLVWSAWAFYPSDRGPFAHLLVTIGKMLIAVVAVGCLGALSAIVMTIGYAIYMGATGQLQGPVPGT